MGSVKSFNLPDPGEGLVEAEIVTWKVKVGDTVKINDIIVEIETAKSLVELPVPYAGTVTALHVPEGETVSVGTPIISVDTGIDDGLDDAPAGVDVAATEGEGRVAVLVGYGPKTTEAKRRARKSGGPPGAAPVASATPAAPAAVPVAAAPTPAAPAPAGPAPAGPAPGSGGHALAKPPVRKYAKDIGIDLSQVTPTGSGGIVTRADVEGFAAAAAAAPATVEAGGERAAYVAPVFAAGGERETRVPIKGVRKVTAQAMVGSAFTAPHVTEFITADVTATMELVDRLRGDREFRDLKISPLLIVAKAVLLASRRNPGANATWDEAAQEIVVKNYVNLGIAAATPRGLMVPNIKDADQMSLRQLADAMAHLVSTARSGRTPPADMSGGSITITNVGVFGVDTGTPILNPGEAAILCFGTIRQMPWVVGGQIVPRWVTQLSLSFDHRMIDGDLGSRFLADVAAVLHDPTRGLVWG